MQKFRKTFECKPMQYSRRRENQKLKSTCPTCGKELNSPKQLRKHIKFVHDKVSTHFCDKCDYKTYSKINLTKHVKRVHEGKL